MKAYRVEVIDFISTSRGFPPTGVKVTEDQVAARLEEYLDRFHDDGWEFVNLHYNSSIAYPLAIFRKRSTE